MYIEISPDSMPKLANSTIKDYTQMIDKVTTSELGVYYIEPFNNAIWGDVLFSPESLVSHHTNQPASMTPHA